MFRINIERATIKNTKYRKILYTNEFQQVVLMSLEPGETIPMEVHHGSQFIRIEHGRGYAIINGKRVVLSDGISIVIPPHTPHFIAATSELKLYTIYSPPEH